MLALAAALSLAAAPQARAVLDTAVDALSAAYPGARLVRADGGGLEHASGLAVPRLARGDEANARAFLLRDGAAFGILPGTELETRRVVSAPGGDGVAVFRRVVAGLPVFGGEVAVGWRADGAVTVVNGPRVLATVAGGDFAVDAEAARAVALGAAPGLPGASSVERGWLPFEAALVPAYRVLHGATDPLDSFVSYVDGASGALLRRLSRKRTATTLHPCPTSCAGTTAPCLCAWRDSPLAPPTADLQGNAPQAFPARNLVAPGDRLSGTRTAVYDCRGGTANFATCSSCSGGTCAGQLAAASGGNFLVDPDSTLRRVDDPFAEQSAYYHIDDHSAFLDSLDPQGFALRTPAGGIGYIPGLVNVLEKRADGTMVPYDNAYFTPNDGVPPGASGLMVYGQGTLVDTSYDAEIVYHELTHAAVDVTAGFEDFVDASGLVSDPTSLNEGTADTFAFAHVARSLADAGASIASASCLSPFFGAELGLDCLRQAANVKTCRGNGPDDGRNPGRDGEPHDDGEIWTGFTWALLRAADAVGGSPLRQGVASAMFKALEAVGPHPTYLGYASTIRQKMADAGLPQAALDFADCTIAQRDLAGCSDRAVALYSGERAQGFIIGLSTQQGGNSPAGQQYFVDVPCGAVALHVQSGDATGRGVVYVRYGQPVSFGSVNLTAPQYDWLLSGSQPEAVLGAGGCQGCDACSGAQTPFGAGRWYFLPAGGLLVPSSNASNAFELGVSLEMPPGAAPPARVPFTIGASATAPNACAWGGGPAPTPGGAAAVPAAPPPVTACAAPVAPAALPAACKPASSSGSSRGGGCGCGTGTSGDLALPLVALAALAARRRAKSLPVERARGKGDRVRRTP